jgi:hypothetical protein
MLRSLFSAANYSKELARSCGINRETPIPRTNLHVLSEAKKKKGNIKQKMQRPVLENFAGIKLTNNSNPCCC